MPGRGLANIHTQVWVCSVPVWVFLSAVAPASTSPWKTTFMSTKNTVVQTWALRLMGVQKFLLLASQCPALKRNQTGCCQSLTFTHFWSTLYIYFWLCLGLFSSYGARAALPSDFSCCSTQTLGWLGSVVVAQKGLIAPGSVGSPQIRDRTHVPCSWQGDFQPLDHQGNPDPHLLSVAFEGIEAHRGQLVRNSGLNISSSVDKELPWLSRCLTLLNTRSRTKLFFKTIAKYPVLNFLLICISLFT